MDSDKSLETLAQGILALNVGTSLDVLANIPRQANLGVKLAERLLKSTSEPDKALETLVREWVRLRKGYLCDEGADDLASMLYALLRSRDEEAEHRGFVSALDEIVASLKTWPHAGIDIKVGEAVEGLIRRRDERALRIVEEVHRKFLWVGMGNQRSESVCDEIKRRLEADDAKI